MRAGENHDNSMLGGGLINLFREWMGLHLIQMAMRPIVPYGGQHFIWNLRVDVRAGSNSITFDKSNLAAVY